jgi:hypothetical protein
VFPFRSLTILLEVKMTDEDAEGILNERIKELEEEIKKALMELEEQGLEPWKKREQRNKLKDLDGERNMLNNAMMMDSASKQRIAGKVLASKANTIAAETMNARARDGGVLAIGANGNGGSGNSVFAVAGVSAACWEQGCRRPSWACLHRMPQPDATTNSLCSRRHCFASRPRHRWRCSSTRRPCLSPSATLTTMDSPRLVLS